MSKRKLGKAKAEAKAPGSGAGKRNRKRVILFPEKIGTITRAQAEAAVDAVLRRRAAEAEGGQTPS